MKSPSLRPRRASVEPLEARTHLAAAALLDAEGHDLSARKDALAKGVNLSHVFWLPRYEYSTPRWEFKGWATSDAARGDRDDKQINDWEDYVNAALPKAEIAKIAKSGFTYVRLPVDINFAYRFDEDHPEAGGSLRNDALDLLRAKVREITDRGLSVVIAPFRTDNTTRSLDLQVWDPRWRTMLEGFLESFTRYVANFPRDMSPDKVILQPFNEPHLSEIWRAGKFEKDVWVVRDLTGKVILRIRPYEDQPDSELTVTAKAWAPVQAKLVDAIRRADPGRRFTILTATPLDERVTFKSGSALREAIYELDANRNNVSGEFAEAALVVQRDFDTFSALDFGGSDFVVRSKDAGDKTGKKTSIDRNVVYGVHYYANGIVSTEQGDYYSADFSLIYPLPFNLPALSAKGKSVRFVDDTNLPRRDDPNAVTTKYVAAMDRTLALVQQRLGIDANGYTLDESQWVGLDYDRQFVRDRRAAIAASGTGNAYDDVRALYLDQIVPEVAKLFRYDIRSGTPEAIRDAVDVGQRWAERTDLDPRVAGRQRPFVVVDEFGIRDHSWQLFGDQYRYVRPFEGYESERTDWIRTVRSAIDGTSSDNGTSREKMGWAAWDYLGELAITEPETVSGGDPYLYGVPSEGTVLYSNIISYRRRLNPDIAAALGVKAFDF